VLGGGDFEKCLAISKVATLHIERQVRARPVRPPMSQLALMVHSTLLAGGGRRQVVRRWAEEATSSGDGGGV